MDNRINEIRRKISALRLEMADIEAAVRASLNSDRDCTQQASAQMDLRRKINLLVGEWKAAGGGGVLPDVRNRVRLRLGKTLDIAALKASEGEVELTRALSARSSRRKSPALPRGFRPR